MSEFITVEALKSELETELKNGGADGKVSTTNLYNKLVDLIDSSGLFLEKIEVPAADIYTVNSSAIEVLAAKGANITTIPVMIAAVKEAGSAYSGANDITIEYQHQTDDLLTLAATGFLDQTSKTIVFASNFNSLKASDNDPLQMKSTKDPTASGGSTVIVYIFYRILDLS